MKIDLPRIIYKKNGAVNYVCRHRSSRSFSCSNRSRRTLYSSFCFCESSSCFLSSSVCFLSSSSCRSISDSPIGFGCGGDCSGAEALPAVCSWSVGE